MRPGTSTRAAVQRVVCCLGATIAIAAHARAQDPTRVVIRRPQIESAGWFNIAETLTGATGWQRTTLDGVSFFASSDGLPSGSVAPAEPEWLVLIDGQRVITDAFGAKMLELLPLSPAQIESVTVTRVPRLAAGTIAGRGVVEFHTRRPVRGPALAGAWHSGNVTGDPGPFAFTPAGGQNVDRLGPYNHALASLGAAGWDLVAAAHQGSSHITHRGIRERFEPAVLQQLGVHQWAPYDAVNGRLGGAVLGGRHDLVAGRAWVNGPLFFPLIGGEQVVRGALEHVGGSGSVVAGAATVGYQLTHSALDARELASPIPFVAGHSRRRTGGVVDISVSNDRGSRARIGASVGRWTLEQTGSRADRSDASLFGELTAAIGSSAHDLSAALVRSSGGPLVVKGVMASRINLDSLTTVTTALSVVQYATGEDGTWIDRALLGIDTLRRERNERAWADIGATRLVAERWTLDVAARVGVAGGVRLLEPNGVAHTAARAAVAELRGGLSLPVTARYPVAHVAYRYATPVGGDRDVRAALRATPVHALEGNVAAVVAGDFRVGAFLYVASRTQWSALRGGPATPVTLAAISRLDVSAEKWFWHHRVRTQILLRNVLNASERYHPLGAYFPLRAHLTAGLALPALP